MRRSLRSKYRAHTSGLRAYASGREHWLRNYDRQGRPIDFPEALSLAQDPRYCVVDRTSLDDAHVSTVWLMGINHNYGDGPPILFETMVSGGALDGQCFRYATEEEARRGHADVVALARRSTIRMVH